MICLLLFMIFLLRICHHHQLYPFSSKIIQGYVNRFQSVLWAATQLELQLPKWASVFEAKTPLAPLSRLRVDSKLCSTINKCLHSNALQYTWSNYAHYIHFRDVVVTFDWLHTAISSYWQRSLRPLFLVDFLCRFSVLERSTPYSLFSRTHIYLSQCLKNCWKQNFLTESVHNCMRLCGVVKMQ